MKNSKISLLILALTALITALTLSAQDEKTNQIDFKTQLMSNDTLILLSEADAPEFDGKLNVEKEYADVQAISFPCEKNTKEEPCPKNHYAKVYIKQSGGVLFIAFYVPKSFQVDRFIQIAVCNDTEHVAAYTYNPLNVHRITPFFKEFIFNNDSTLAPLQGGLAKSDTVHKDYWTAEIKLNLREIKITPGILGQQLFILFAVSDASKKSYFSRYFQGWHVSSSYFLLRSKDNWGKENSEILIAQNDVTKEFQHFMALNNIFLKADTAFKKNDIQGTIKWLELLLELDDTYYMVAQKISELYFNTNELEKALEAINRALKIHPYYLEASSFKGGILLQMGKKDEALQHFKLLYAEYPDKTELALQIGKIYIDLALKSKEEIEAASSDAERLEKQQNYKKLILTAQSWFDGLAINNLEDIRVLLSIASIVRHSNIEINLEKFIKLAEKLVSKNINFGSSLISYYCFNRDIAEALVTTNNLVGRATKLKQENFDAAVKFQEEEEPKIKGDEKLTPKEKTTAIRELIEKTMRMKNAAYLQFMELISELADIFKKHNIFEGFNMLMQQLSKLLEEKHFPRGTLEGAAAEEKIVAEYLVSRLSVEDFKAASEVYEKLKKLVTSPHSAVRNYIEAYKDVVNYEKYWEIEIQKRNDEKKADLPVVKIHTQKGVITCVLFEDDAPNTVKNFIKNIQDGIYTDDLFHRVEPAFIIQGGMAENPPGNIATEISSRKFFRGTLGMANVVNVQNSENTQFFITVLPVPWLNETHTVFGRVVEGLEILDAITENDAILKIEIIRKRPKTDYTPVYSPSKQK